MSSLKSIAALVLAATLGLSSASQAGADPVSDDPSAGEPRSQRVLVENDAMRVTVTDLAYEEPEVRPQAGTAVTVRSGREVTVYYGVSAACTRSVTTYDPFQYTPNLMVEAASKLSQSNGCASDYRIEGYADKDAFFGWSEQGSGIGYAAPGSTKQITVVVNCTNTKATTWRTRAVTGASTVQTSRSVTMNCGT